MSTQVDLLKKYGLPIRGFVGQHLLIDPNIQKKIVEGLDPQPGDLILEIGPGLGALTGELLKRDLNVWTVEKDDRFVEILQKEYGTFAKDRFHILHQDILKINLESDIFSKKKGTWKVISNLPYYITAPILFHLIEHRQRIQCAVLTMQREVARRLVAAPGSKDYGRLTLGVRYSADVQHLFDIPPNCFTPKPQVHSSAVKLTFHQSSQKPKDIDETLLFYVIKIVFSRPERRPARS